MLPRSLRSNPQCSASVRRCSSQRTSRLRRKRPCAAVSSRGSDDCRCAPRPPGQRDHRRATRPTLFQTHRGGNGTCVKGEVDPATGLMFGEITPVENAGQVNAYMTLNIRGKRSKTDPSRQ